MKVSVYVTELRVTDEVATGTPTPADLAVDAPAVREALRLGRQTVKLAGEIEVEPGNFVRRVQVFAEGMPDHPVADIPFALGMGRWVWVPPEPIEDEEL